MGPRRTRSGDQFKNGKTSIRSGFGVFYNPIEQLVLEQFSAEPPFGGSPLINTTFIQTPFYSQFGFQFPNPFNGILNTKAGDTVTLTLVENNGQQREIKAQLGARPHVEDRGQQ